MKKRIFLVLTVILAVVLVLPGQITEVKADTTSDENGITFDFNEKKETLTVSGTGTISKNSEWETYKDKVQFLVIEEGITAIGDEAFSNCPRLKHLTLPEGLKTIGDHAFYGCTTLQELEIPSTVSKVEDYAFCGCVGVAYLTLPEGLETVGEYAFSCVYIDPIYHATAHNYPLTELTIPSTVKTIGNHAFEGYIKMKTLNLQEGLETIGDYAFYESRQLKELEIPSTVKSIGAYAFANNTKLESLTLHEGLEKMGTFAFRVSYPDDMNCLKEVTLPSTLTEMGNTIFDPDILIFCNNAYQVQYCEKNRYGYADITNGFDLNQADIDIYGTYFTGPKFEYTGSEICPEVLVAYTYANGRAQVFEKDVDYTITYTNNKECGTASIIIKGKGFCSGEVVLDFEIYKPTDTWKAALEYDSVLYDGTEKKPKVILQATGQNLVEGVDYVIQYKNNVEEGEATVTITGKGGYNITITKTFTIYKLDILYCVLSIDSTPIVYDGTEKKPKVTLADGKGNALKELVDYQLIYENCINPGTATVRVLGLGIYKGERTVSYTIYEKSPYGDVTTPEQTYVPKEDTESPYQSDDGNDTYGNEKDEDEEYDDEDDESDTLVIKNLTYTITNPNRREIEVVGTPKKNVSKVVIPATVKINGKKYKVTSIGHQAFYKNTKIKSVVIGKNVTSIGRYAFYGCKKLKTITINTNSVVDFSNNAIKGISKKAVIKVPKKLVKIYQQNLKSKTGFKKTMKIKKK